MTTIRLDSIERAITDIASGKPVVVIDDEDRENEGDLIFAAELATPDLVSFMVRYTSGYICVPVTETDADRLDLPPMRHVNQDRRGTAYTVTVDARDVPGTGISAFDRAFTIRALASGATTPEDFLRPGHVVPLRGRAGGVLNRSGHTEAAIDLAALAGLRPAGVLCEIVSETHPAEMARAEELRCFADEHHLALVSIADLIAYRCRTERVVKRLNTSSLKLAGSEFSVTSYVSTPDKLHHLALTLGELGDGMRVLTRVQAECLLGHCFGSTACDCRSRLDDAIVRIAAEGRGVLLHLGTHREPLACPRNDHLAGSTQPDDAEIGHGSQILADLGVRSMRLLSDSQRRYPGLEGYGLTVEEALPLLGASASAEHLG